jgi:hypothetical protein
MSEDKPRPKAPTLAGVGPLGSVVVVGAVGRVERSPSHAVETQRMIFEPPSDATTPSSSSDEVDDEWPDEPPPPSVSMPATATAAATAGKATVPQAAAQPPEPAQPAQVEANASPAMTSVDSIPEAPEELRSEPVAEPAPEADGRKAAPRGRGGLLKAAFAAVAVVALADAWGHAAKQRSSLTAVTTTPTPTPTTSTNASSPESAPALEPAP